MKKKNEIILDYFLDKILPWLIGICILIYGAYYVFFIFLQDREQFFTGDEILVIEAKYPLGSIFNKDAIEIAPDKIIFYENSFFQSKAISLPYKKIERIVFTDGQFWDSIKIETRGFLSKNYEIYIRDDANRKKLEAFFESSGLEIVEKNTILKYLFDYFTIQSPTQKKAAALPDQQAGQEAKAIQLAKDARTLFELFDHRLYTKLPQAKYLTNDSQICDELNKIKGDFQVIGWKAKKVDDDTYLVEYTIDRRGAVRGWPFEVKVSAGIVRYVIGDKELERKYGWRSDR